MTLNDLLQDSGEKIKWNYSREQRAGIMERKKRGKNVIRIRLSGFKVGIIKNKKSNSENSKRLKAPSIKLRLDADRGLCASVNSR